MRTPASNGVPCCIQNLFHKQKKLQAFTFHGSLFLGLTYIFYPTLSLMQFKGYVCESIDEERLLSVDLSIDCESSRYQR